MVGITGLKLNVTHDLFRALVPFNLLLNLALLLIYHGPLNKSFAWKALAIILAGILVEMLGVNTGHVFGEYSYGRTLGLKVLGTPLIIGVNWLMLVYAGLVIASRLTTDSYHRMIITAVLMVAYDFVLEPAAISLDMWNWGGPVPLQNYLAWLVIAFVMAFFAEKSGLVNRDNKIASPLFFVQMLFFIILDVWIVISELWV